MIRSAWIVACAALSVSVTANVMHVVGPKSPVVVVTPFARGATFPLLSGETPLGNRISSFTPSNSVVYVFSAGCSWCQQDYVNVESFRRQSAERRFIPITIDAADGKLEEYIKSRPALADAVILDRSLLSREMISKLGTTPQWISINSIGVVARSWEGALFGSRKEEIERFFHLALPGVIQPKAQPR